MDTSSTAQGGGESFKRGICEMKTFGSEVYSVSWDVGSGWVGVTWGAVPEKFKTDV